MTTSTIILLSVIAIIITSKIISWFKEAKDSKIAQESKKIGLNAIKGSGQILDNTIGTAVVSSDMLYGAALFAHGSVRKALDAVDADGTFVPFNKEHQEDETVSVTKEELNNLVDALLETKLAEMQAKPTRTRKNTNS